MERRLDTRLTAGGCALAILLVGGTVALVRSRSPSCSTAAPVPSLSPQLRSVGELGQPYDPADEQSLEEVAVRAASALHPRLIGTGAGHSVSVAARPPADHDALVVPLQAPARGAVAGLVSFLRDCTGRAYYSDSLELPVPAPGTPAARAFPAVSRDEAERRLGTGDLRLVYTASPFRPLWLDRGSGRTTPG